MTLAQRPTVAKPRVPPSAAPIGFVALWSLALFVTVCLILLSLVEGAAERKRARALVPASNPSLLSRLKRRLVHRSVPRDA